MWFACPSLKVKPLLTEKMKKKCLDLAIKHVLWMKLSGTLYFSWMSPNLTYMDRTIYGMF